MADIGPSDQVRDSIEKNKDRRSDDNVDYVEASLSSVRIPAGPTETDVRKVCLWMMIMSAVIIAVMLVISHLEESNVVNNGKPSQSVAGWVAVVGAAIVFGSTGVPMKSPALALLKIDSFVFALYTSLGIFFVSVPLIIYLFVIDEFQFRPWAVLGATDIVIIGIISAQLTFVPDFSYYAEAPILNYYSYISAYKI